MSTNGQKHDKRQWLLSRLKRMLRKGWFFRLLIVIAWKLIDRFTD